MPVTPPVSSYKLAIANSGGRCNCSSGDADVWVVQIALRRPYTFVVFSFLIAIFGGLAALRTPTDIFPNINIPVVSVVWTYNGLLPNDMSGRVIYYYERTLTAQVGD